MVSSGNAATNDPKFEEATDRRWQLCRGTVAFARFLFLDLRSVAAFPVARAELG